ncbi:hypothetical protein [Streptomyces sp. NPDC045714]|uniref:hypothetical protein n=1 Tax=Streptomyces sp. NPDC045714 TaxID=3154913 RepID=UPI0033F4E883
MTPTLAALAVQFASDVTLADVEAMRAFLDQQVEASLRSSSSSHAERRIATALERAAWPHFYAAEKVFDVDDGSAGAECPATALERTLPNSSAMGGDRGV